LSTIVGCSHSFHPPHRTPEDDHDDLTATLETFLNFRIFLIQSLPPLLGEGVLVSVTGVMSRQNVNGCVQRREARLPSHLWKSPVITHKVNHLLLEIFAKILHAVGTLGKTGGGDHVIANTGGIVFVVVGKTPVGGEFVRCRLFGDGNFGRGHKWKEDGGCGSGRGSLEELATSRLFILKER
jgi:hypothetical protein